MADTPDQSEKTEEPSQKKLDDAHKKGDVAKSPEVGIWFTLIGILIVFMVFGKSSTLSIGQSLQGFFIHSHDIRLDSGSIQSLIMLIGKDIFSVLLVPFLLFLVMGVGGNLIQHKPLISAEKMKPKLEKISLLKGIKRIFSSASLMNFVKGIAKLIIIAFLMMVVVWPDRNLIYNIIGGDVSNLMNITYFISLKLVGVTVLIMTVIAIADYLYQRYTWHKRQMMTIKEMKDEYKQMEGNPEVKNKLREIRIERGRRRMMTQVPDATVVVTNPTHYAIALKYDVGMNAPVCLAKGVDLVALRIRKIASENDVAIIENPPLARALYGSVEIDEEIPIEHYKAVAEVIGFVSKFNNKLRSQF